MIDVPANEYSNYNIINADESVVPKLQIIMMMHG
jgi:hypothetical protein